jgi:carboxypeptidase C (cathepsin A)
LKQGKYIRGLLSFSSSSVDRNMVLGAMWWCRYVELDDGVRLFYYFIQSERDPEEDPVLLWLTGGPGCSALSGLVYEIGPFYFDFEGYTGSGLPTLLYKPASWTQVHLAETPKF